MIRPGDAQLHKPSSTSRSWAETNYWGFHIPGTDYLVTIYALFRTNLGVVQTMVVINSRRAQAVWEGDYWDFQAHVPMGENFDLTNYSLESGLTVRAIEPNRHYEVNFDDHEGTSIEFTFRAGSGLEPADAMVLFRSAAKQIAQRNGYHLTFMCRPRLANVMSSGWHLHQSLKDRKTHANAFMDGREPLSALGMHYMAGLLHHARGAAAFSTPTLNGYKRYRPFSLAPDHAVWGQDNRGVMVRVLGGPGDPATHLENRVGEPAANPYLYMAAQIVAGLDGIARELDPGPCADTPYETAAPFLPKSLEEAVSALRHDACFAHGFGQSFIDYFLHIKQFEIDRYQAEVTDWEQKEYFELF